MGRALQRLGPGMGEAIEVLTGAARPILDRWFECEELKGTIATDAIIGAFMAPSMPGTAYVLFHHVMGETNGKRGVWSYVRGGMGGLTQALASAARDLGVEIRTEAEVAKILTRRRTRDRRRADQRRSSSRAKRVASGVDCHVTFEKLLDPAELPPNVPRCGRAHLVQQCVVQDQRRARAAAELHRDARSRAGPAAFRHRASLPGSRLHRTRLRRREVRLDVARAGRRVHDAVVARFDASRRPAST